MLTNRINRFIPTNRMAEYQVATEPCLGGFVTVPAIFVNAATASAQVYRLAYEAAQRQVLTRRRNRLQAYRWN